MGRADYFAYIPSIAPKLPLWATSAQYARRYPNQQLCSKLVRITFAKVHHFFKSDACITFAKVHHFFKSDACITFAKVHHFFKSDVVALPGRLHSTKTAEKHKKIADFKTGDAIHFQSAILFVLLALSLFHYSDQVTWLHERYKKTLGTSPKPLVSLATPQGQVIKTQSPDPVAKCMRV